MKRFNKEQIYFYAKPEDTFVKVADLHKVRVELASGMFVEHYADTSEAASMIGSAFFAAKAKRYWVDDVLQAGPMEEVIAELEKYHGKKD